MDSLRDFYRKHQQLLEENYPGLTWDYLKRELGEKASSNDVKEKLLEGLPIAYITGHTYFYNSEMNINHHCLIPRHETELLVEHGLKQLKSIESPKPRVLDMGTGCGAIILSFMREANRPLECVATDICSEALKMAEINYFLLQFTIHPESHLQFCRSDRLDSVEGEFDLILSNPPYIKENADREGVHPMVDRFEPHSALYLPDEEYDEWFALFLQQLFSKLVEGGTFIVEGHENHLEALAEKARRVGFSHVQIEWDLTGRARFLTGVKG